MILIISVIIHEIDFLIVKPQVEKGKESVRAEIRADILADVKAQMAIKPDSTLNYLDWLYMGQSKEIANLKREVANLKKGK
jgi:hypothetical protein